MVLVFHFILLSNLTLILYSLFLPKLTWIALKVMIHPSPLTNHSTRVTNATPITSYKKGPLGWQVVKRAYSPCQATAHSAPALRGPCSYSVRVGHFDSNDNLDVFLANINLKNPSKPVPPSPASRRVSHLPPVCFGPSRLWVCGVRRPRC